MPQSASNCVTGFTPVWDCLNAEIDEPGEEKDSLIGLDRLCGIEIAYAESSNAQIILKTSELATGDDVEEWIGRLPPTKSTTSPRLKLLLGCRVNGSESFHVREEVPATRFPKNILCASFGLPPFAVSKAECHGVWFVEVPGRLRLDGLESHGIGVISLAAVWSYNDKTRETFAFLVADGEDVRENLIRDIGTLRSSFEQPDFVPFITSNVSFRAKSRLMAHWVQISRDAELKISRYPDSRARTELFAAANYRADTLSDLQRDLKTILELLGMSLRNKFQRSSQVSDAAWNKLLQDREDLQAGLHCLKLRVETMVQDTERRLVQVTRQLSTLASRTAESQQQVTIELAQASTRMAVESRKDQAVGIEIARASKAIAADNRRDSSSMKTLAVVTMVYLPGTSVASVLAMPLFQSNGHGGLQTNTQLWVYFAVTIPLTLLTILAWWVWFNFKTKGRGDEGLQESKRA